SEATRMLADPNYFAAMMVSMGDADGMVTGTGQNYADAVRPILRTIGIHRSGVPAGLNLVLTDSGIFFLSDTSVNFNPSAEECANIAVQTARVAEYFGLEPRVAMLSFSNFSGDSGTPKKMKEAADILRRTHPHLMVDGDMQADTAVSPDILQSLFPFSTLKGGANILIFPNLESANISYKLLQQLGKVEVIGPFLMGIRKSATVLQRTTTVEGIFNSCVLAALEAQYIKKIVMEKE
ncbi:MAG TPA: phosphate acyltransferase, partial [Pseudobdellovibrionaceae bacterium]|nr:phosphate acyltransferase [Pseudobdellovibrionaceae bacterium]